MDRTSLPHAGTCAWLLPLIVAAAAAGVDTGPITSVEPPDTAYPIPAGALFVSNGGDDAAPGDESRPLRTLGAAIARAAGGATIVLRAGTYREGFDSVFKKLTLQPYPHEQAWLKGTEVVGGWVAEGGAWRKDGWTSPLAQDSGDTRLRNDDDPASMRPDMAFIDGSPLRQVMSRTQVAAGTFFMDDAGHRVWLGDDPSGRVVEITVLPKAIQFNTPFADGSVVRGLGFAQYGSYVNYGWNIATLIVGDTTSGITIEDNVIIDSASAGLVVGGPDHVVRGNVIWRNTFLGAIVNRATRFAFTGNRVSTNNQGGLAAGGSSAAAIALAAAGVKVTRTSGTFADNVFDGNRGNGIWFDLSCHDCAIVGNLARANAWHGVFYEVSARALIASNVIADNGDAGLLVAGSNHVRIWNNTIVGGTQPVMIADDERPIYPKSGDSAPEDDELASGITWNTADVTLVDNLFSVTGFTGPLVDVVDGNAASSGHRIGAEAMIPVAQMDFNGYHRDAPAPVLVRWARADIADSVLFPSLDGASGFRTTGRELHGFQEIGGPGVVIDAAGGDYRRRPGGAAAGIGAPMPADIASLVGVPADAPGTLGAIRWPGSDAHAGDTGDRSGGESHGCGLGSGALAVLAVAFRAVTARVGTRSGRAR